MANNPTPPQATTSSNRSAPAQAAAVPKRLWTYALWALVSIAGIVGIMIIVSLVRGGREQPRQTSSAAQQANATRQEVAPQVRATVCPKYHSEQTRGCMASPVWSAWFPPEQGPEINGMQFCVSPGVQLERMEKNGTTHYRLKTDVGELFAEYRLFPGDRPCPPRFPPA